MTKHGKHKQPRAKLRVEKGAKKRRQNRRRLTKKEFMKLSARERWLVVADWMKLSDEPEPPAND